MIKHSYIVSHSNNLFCSHSSPDHDVSNIGVLLVQPFAEERILMQRALFNLSQELNDKGMPVCRFDFYGQGDSDGDTNEATVKEWLINLHDVIQTFKKTFRLEDVVLCGFRFGATLAMIASSEIEELKNLIVIDPVINGKQYMDSVLRSNLTYQMVTYGKVTENRDALIKKLVSGHSVSIDGYLINSEFYQQLADIDLMHYVYNNKNVLALRYSKTTTSRNKKLSELCNYLRESGCQAIEKIIPDPTAWKASEMYNMNLSNTSKEIDCWINTYLKENNYKETNHG